MPSGWSTASEVFGDVADSPRFPLLIKLLDAEEKLSLQVHPPADVAAEIGGEPKTEFWYIADAQPERRIVCRHAARRVTRGV